jgi:hypothetical protein
MGSERGQCVRRASGRFAVTGTIRGSLAGPIRPAVAGVIRPWPETARELGAGDAEVVALRTGSSGIEMCRLDANGGFGSWSPVEEPGKHATEDHGDGLDWPAPIPHHP